MRNRINLYDFIETLHEEAKKNNLDIAKVKILSVGNGTWNNKWYHIITVSEDEFDPSGTKLYIPIYDYEENIKDD